MFKIMFGDHIKEYLEYKGWTLFALSNHIGITNKKMKRIMNHEEDLSIELSIKLGKVFWDRSLEMMYNLYYICKDGYVKENQTEDIEWKIPKDVYDQFVIKLNKIKEKYKNNG